MRRVRSINRCWITPACLLLLAGCTTIDLGSNGSTKTVLGIARIELPATAPGMSAVGLKTFGIGWDGGPFLGFHESSWVIASPAECQLVVIVRSNVEADNAKQVLERLKGEKICVADFSHSSSRVARR